MTPSGRARFALPALFAGATGIAFSPIFVRLSELGPSATAFHRVFLALPLLWLWLALEQRGRTRTRRAGRSDGWLLVLAGVLFAGDLGVWHWSITYTSVANATLFANVAPVFVTLAAWSLLGERITATFLGGLALTMAGAAVMVGSSFAFGLDHVFGDGLGILTALFYAGYLVTVKHLRASFSAITIMAYTSAATAAVLLPVALLSGEGLTAASWFGWGVLIALALVSQIGGQGMIAYALAHLPASFSSVGLMLQPALAAMFAWVILAEPLGPLQAFGGAVVIAGILIARWGTSAARPDTAAADPARS